MSKKKLIYAIDDELSIRELYKYSLESNFDIVTFKSGKELFEGLSNSICDLLLLDLMLPNEDGFDVLKELKSVEKYRNIKIIMVSAKGSEINKVKGLNEGADDYISKPFGILELIARINSNLRKSNSFPKLTDDCKNFKDLFCNEKEHLIYIGSSKLNLTLKEYNLLKYLISNHDLALAKDDIFKNVWGESAVLETRTLDVHISSLRKKLKSSVCEIETIHGVGYILK